MPKMSKEDEDKIIELIDQGYKDAGISRKTGKHRTTIAKRRKEHEEQKRAEEKPEPEKENIQEEQPLEPEKYSREPINHRASPSQINVLEKRISELEESQRGSKPHLLKRRISDLETSQRVGMRMINSSITDFRKMKKELLESAKRRQTDDDACKQMNKNGFCLLHYFSYDEVEKSEYLKPMGHTEVEGKKVYHIKVREHPLICSACPDYEPKS